MTAASTLLVSPRPTAPAAPAAVGVPAVQVIGLEKRYTNSPVAAVAGISFTVEVGELFGLLGPNGAGKSTTVGILTTRVGASGGVAQVAGVDVAADPVGARRVLGVVPQRNSLDRSLSVRKNLTFHARFHGVPRAERNAQAQLLLDQFGLTDRADEKPDLFSGGQTQRMMIARALMHAPRVLFLDEPSSGLDPAARLFLWERIEQLKAQGTTIVLTTHDMHEAARLADRVGIMDQGRILALDSPQALISQMRGAATVDVDVAPGPASPAAVTTALTALVGVVRAEPVRPVAPGAGPPDQVSGVRLYVDGDPSRLLAPVVDALGRVGARMAGARIAEPSLEDVFIQLTGRSLR